jgi:hypothetical protein
MKDKKIVLIAGDSWGCGEWTNTDGTYLIAHPGLAQYLLDSGYQIINLSIPGGSNKNTCNKVADFFQVNKHLQISHVIVFQTEWIRCIRVERSAIIADDVTHGYHNLKNRIISRFYYALSQISIKNNIPIHIIGGCSDTIWLDQFEMEYPGLCIVCQSLTNLLLENNHRNLDPVDGLFSHSNESQVEYIKKNINSTDLELLLNDIDKGTQRFEIWKNNKKYFPDGAHANRHGHRILFEFLKTQILNL